MHRMTKKEFQDTKGHCCPFCWEDNVDYVEGSLWYLEEVRTCLKCNATWTEHHRVSHYSIINKPQEEPYVKDE